MNCARCNRDIANAKDVIKCVDCGAVFHAACCRIRTVAKLNAMSSRSVSSWKCDECVQDTTSTVSNKSDPEDTKVTDLLVSMKKYMEQHFETIEKQLETLQTSQEELKCRIADIESENVLLKAECEEVKKDNVLLRDKVSCLESDVAELQQYSRNHNLEIRGIPPTREEDVYMVLQAVARALGVGFSRDSISAAHRLPTPRGKKFYPSIVVQFISRSIRASWLDAARQKRINTSDLATTLPPGPVFVVEHLTVRNKAILGQAKHHVKEGHLTYAWTREGKIFIRKTAESRAIRVTNLDEVEEVAGAKDGGGGEGVKTTTETGPRGTP